LNFYYLYQKLILKTLGKFLSEYEFDTIFSSDLNRCLETTYELIKQSKIYKDKITINQLLREKAGGILEGKKFNYIQDIIIVRLYILKKFLE